MSAKTERKRVHKPVDPAQDNLPHEQQRRLAEVNAQLAVLGLKPFTRLGNPRNREWVIRRVIGWYGNEYFSIVTFEIQRPDGSLGTHQLVFNGTNPKADGAIVVPIVGRHIATVRQHRLSVLDSNSNGWTTEFPRGFARSSDVKYMEPRGGASVQIEDFEPATDPSMLRSLPLGILGPELRPLIESGSAALTKLVYLDDVYENTGISRVIVPVYLAIFMADESVLKTMTGNRDLRIRYHTLAELRRDRRKIGLRDEASLSALYLLWEFLDENPDHPLLPRL